jgi:hypothetical protein
MVALLACEVPFLDQKDNFSGRAQSILLPQTKGLSAN